MRILKTECVALIIDFQERLVPHMMNKELMLEKTKILLMGLQILEVPIIISEQYTKGLGLTVDQVKELFKEFAGMEKISFSCFDDKSISDKIKSIGKKNVIIAGIEAHVCVMQTAIDLIENGFLPVIVEDCVSSRNINDKNLAMQRMMQAGALITTTESLLFELTRFAGNDQFKSISKLVK